jgi:hypothetical protein
MAVRASHNTLLDLCSDRFPRARAAGVSRDVSDLISHVIEFEYDDVTLTTVNARVRGQVGNQCGLNFGPATLCIRDEAHLLAVTILTVVTGIAFGEARAAPRL